VAIPSQTGGADRPDVAESEHADPHLRSPFVTNARSAHPVRWSPTGDPNMAAAPDGHPITL
jgi:hypothetical protein